MFDDRKQKHYLLAMLDKAPDHFAQRQPPECGVTCHINLGAIKRNFQRLGNPDRIMPVIKSDAYGHGSVPVAKVLEEAGARWFAVGTAEEGQILRSSGINTRIALLMGCINAADWELARKLDLIPLIGNFEDLKKAGELGSPAAPFKIAIKADTGMSRLGFSLSDGPGLVCQLRQSATIDPVLLVSHLSCADDPGEKEFTDGQTECFDRFYGMLKPYFPGIKRSLGNSAATLGLSGSHFDLVRPGLAIYGGNPFANTTREDVGSGLEWAMNVSAPIIHVRSLAGGESISYGRIFTAPKPMRIAVAACGYANGLPRGLSNRFAMLVRGQRAPQIGRICMSMLMLDVSGIENVCPGDQAWIMGGTPKTGHTSPTAQELAEALGTIPYELLCFLGQLNPKIYYTSA